MTLAGEHRAQHWCNDLHRGCSKYSELWFTSDASCCVLHKGKTKQGHLIVTLSLFFPSLCHDECTVPCGEVSNASINFIRWAQQSSGLKALVPINGSALVMSCTRLNFLVNVFNAGKHLLCLALLAASHQSHRLTHCVAIVFLQSYSNSPWTPKQDQFWTCYMVSEI